MISKQLKTDSAQREIFRFLIISLLLVYSATPTYGDPVTISENNIFSVTSNSEIKYVISILVDGQRFDLLEDGMPYLCNAGNKMTMCR